MFIYLFLLVGFRETEEGEERQTDVDLLFHLLMHSLVGSRRCPGQGSNWQHCCIRVTC